MCLFSLLLVSCGSVQRCQPIQFSESENFSYNSRKLPRVFVSHHPLNPTAGTTLNLRIVPELEPGIAVESATAELLDGSAETLLESRLCPAAGGGVFSCNFALPASSFFSLRRERIIWAVSAGLMPMPSRVPADSGLRSKDAMMSASASASSSSR